MYELTIYDGGVAILTDHAGRSVWTSDADEDFREEFDDAVSFEDADAIVEYLEDCDYIPEGVECEVVEADASGLGDADEDDEEDEDEPGPFE